MFSRLNALYAEQEKAELDWLLDRIRGARSILEIGSRYGHTLREFARACPRALIRSIDIGKDTTSKKRDSSDYGYDLAAVIEGLMPDHDAELLIADSTSDEAFHWAMKWAPYEFIFIDGDHSHDGVRADWENYGLSMGRLVGFHDIANHGFGVLPLWAEIKRKYWTCEYVQEGNNMGIGLVNIGFGRV